MLEARGWVSPDGGPWWFEPAHFPHPVSRLFADVIDRICEGWVIGAKRFGLQRGRARWAYINGYVYYGQRGEGSPGDEELRSRAVRERWWVQETERWLHEEKPAVVAKNHALQSVDVNALDDAALAAHATDALHHLLAVGPLHFEHRGRELVGGELRRLAKEEGVDIDALHAAYAGASPATSRPAELVDAISGGLAGDGIDPAGVREIDDIRASAAGSAALDAYLAEFGHRMIDSYDLACPTLHERPDLIVASVRAAVARRPAPAPALPAMSAELLQLFEEARASHGTEDDDDGICIFWPSGLLRRALLEVGRRRKFEEASYIFEADVDELRALLTGTGPAPEVLAERAEFRRQVEKERPPPVVGGETGGETDASAAPSAGTPRGLRGRGVGTAVARGKACVIRGLDADALARIEPGDILVATTTTPGHNVIMPIVAGIATEHEMGHTVICAREFGIPAVIGIPGILDAVPGGAIIEVNAGEGVVRIVS